MQELTLGPMTKPLVNQENEYIMVEGGNIRRSSSLKK